MNVCFAMNVQSVAVDTTARGHTCLPKDCTLYRLHCAQDEFQASCALSNKQAKKNNNSAINAGKIRRRLS